MSQHYYTTTTKDEQTVFVTAGWDEPMKQFFANVELDLPDSEKEKMDNRGYLYDSMEDINAITEQQDWPYFANKLVELGILLPKALADHLLMDRKNRSMNDVIKTW